MVRWLLDCEPEINIHANNCEAFQVACTRCYADLIDFLIGSTLDDPKIRYIRYQDEYYVVGAQFGKPSYLIDGVWVSTVRSKHDPMFGFTRELAKQVLASISRKKSARTAQV